MAQTHFASVVSKQQLSICYLFRRLEVFSTLVIHIMVFLGYDNIRSGWYVTLWVNVPPSSSVQKAYSWPYAATHTVRNHLPVYMVSQSRRTNFKLS